MTLTIITEIILITALLDVSSDQGSFLLRKLFSNPFPPPNIKVYNREINMVNTKFSRFFSSVKAKKKNMETMNEIQNMVLISLRFMIGFLDSKIVFIKGIKNYFLPKGWFLLLNCIIRQNFKKLSYNPDSFCF